MVDVSPQSQLIPNLPDVIALQCLARIPHSHHPKLFLISKSWRSTLNSSALYNTQSLLRTTETFLYLNLCINFTFHWYTLISHKLFPVCSMPVKSIRSDFAVLGSKIYVIGRSISEIPSNNMWVFLLMRIGREFVTTGVVNGKIYVMGGCVRLWGQGLCDRG
ncbi:hypothetical protein T459_30296 [Capsicum annuum]|uniref:F-box domain-containing protein n=1 Tax=Capsicum annuum TaxID=4072 RepID=A0A2G2Y8I2_CAPAN|nr:hypothetical protein T459_30296 [Capsicum annuum]